MNALIFRWSNIDTNWAKLFLLFLLGPIEKNPAAYISKIENAFSWKIQFPCQSIQISHKKLSLSFKITCAMGHNKISSSTKQWQYKEMIWVGGCLWILSLLILRASIWSYKAQVNTGQSRSQRVWWIGWTQLLLMIEPNITISVRRKSWWKGRRS